VAIRKVAGQFVGGGHHEKLIIDAGLGWPALQGKEKEKFVLRLFKDVRDVGRSAKTRAVSVEAIRAAGLAAVVSEKIIRVERFVSAVVVGGAMKLAGARFGRQVDDAAGALPVLCLVTVELYRHFGDRVHIEGGIQLVAVTPWVSGDAVDADAIAAAAH